MTSRAKGPPRLFEIGSLLFSDRIQQLMDEGRLDPMPLFLRHIRGDWGEVADDRWRENNAALESGGRLESFYVVHRDLAISIVTEADRSFHADPRLVRALTAPIITHPPGSWRPNGAPCPSFRKEPPWQPTPWRNRRSTASRWDISL